MKCSHLNDIQDKDCTSWFRGLSCGKGTPGHPETLCVHVGGCLHAGQQHPAPTAEMGRPSESSLLLSALYISNTWLTRGDCPRSGFWGILLKWQRGQRTRPGRGEGNP